MGRQKRLGIISTDSNEAVEDHVKDHEASKFQDHHTVKCKVFNQILKNVGLQLNKVLITC
ncbi:hypothetical protein Hanom_Chr10g00902661 [Helianthus anomalus]